MGVPKVEEPVWLQQLGNVVKPATRKRCEEARVHPEGLLLGDVPEPRQWCAFEFADKMEQGVAPGLTSTFVEPLEGPEMAEERLCVSRSANRREYLLTSQSGEPLLLAVVSAQGSLFDIYIARSGAPPVALGPAFSLQARGSSLKDWTLRSTRCEQCASRGRRHYGQRELARIHHYFEELGNGKALCMDVQLPAPLESDKGGSAVWCAVCSGAEQDKASVAQLSSRRPRWNPRMRTLTMDFRGRVSIASSKNFQLEVPDAGNVPGSVKLLYGKVGDNQFVLDVKRPLGIAQAFATALTTVHWK
jgi:hypothetical protein